MKPSLSTHSRRTQNCNCAFQRLTLESGQQWMESATGVGEHNAFIREHICAALAFLGIALDADANTRNAATLSSAHRQVVVAVEPTNEEWADKMEHIGLMPSSTGKPGGSRTGEKMADYAIEGGLFMQATDKLLAAGFQVSWIDRFPPRVPHKAQLNVTAAIMAALSESLAAASETALLDQSEPDLGQAPELSELLSPPTAENRSNRVKYRCPRCTTQVWGKPNLKIRCGENDCADSVFEPIA